MLWGHIWLQDISDKLQGGRTCSLKALQEAVSPYPVAQTAMCLQATGCNRPALAALHEHICKLQAACSGRVYQHICRHVEHSVIQPDLVPNLPIKDLIPATACQQLRPICNLYQSAKHLNELCWLCSTGVQCVQTCCAWRVQSATPLVRQPQPHSSKSAQAPASQAAWPLCTGFLPQLTPHR